MTMRSALQVVRNMPLPNYAEDALKYARHPQARTRAFHIFYGSPIHIERPDATFSHMDDQRVAFRAAFVLSEALELIQDGLGIKLSINIEDPFHEGEQVFLDPGDETFCSALTESISKGAGRGKRNLLGVVDALGDLNVVVNGFALELGVDMHIVDQEVCASNFTKMGADGKPIIGDGTTGPVGKVLKGPSFLKPQLALVLGLDPNG